MDIVVIDSDVTKSVRVRRAVCMHLQCDTQVTFSLLQLQLRLGRLERVWVRVRVVWVRVRVVWVRVRVVWVRVRVVWVRVRVVWEVLQLGTAGQSRRTCTRMCEVGANFSISLSASADRRC